MNKDVSSTMMPVNHLVNLLQIRAVETPDKSAFIYLHNGTDERGRLSYAGLSNQAVNISTHLLEQLAAGDTVMLAYPSGLNFISAFFACLQAGIIAVPVPIPRSRRSFSRIENIVKDSNCSVILTDTKTQERMGQRLNNNEIIGKLKVIITDDLGEAVSQDYKLDAVSDTQTAFIQYTSGSTNEPRGVVVSHNNLMHNLAMQQASALTDLGSIFVSWLPMFHDMGLIGKILHSVYVGACCVVMPPESFIEQPVRWLRAISQYRGSFTLAPNFAYGICVSRVSKEEVNGLDLSSLKMAGNGAEPIRSSDISNFCDMYRSVGFRSQVMVPCYGLAEATLLVTSHQLDKPLHLLHLNKAKLREGCVEIAKRDDEHTQTLVSCGPSLLGQTLSIVDAGTRQPLGEKKIGEIWVAGEHIPDGYWHKTRESDDVFHAYDSKNNGPFMRTGDLGFLHHGELFIAGRLKDLIIIYGKNYYPQDIEKTSCAADSQLNPDSAAAFSISSDEGEKLIVVQEVEKGVLEKQNYDNIIDKIRDKIVYEFDLNPFDICLIRKGTLPKTSSGKVQRQMCKSHYQNNHLKLLASMRNDMQDRVLDLDQLMDFRDGIEMDTLAAKGLFGMQIPRAYGGLELSHIELIKVMQTLAELDLSTAMYLGVHHASSYTIIHYADEKLRQKLLPKLASGNFLAAFALTESSSGSNPNSLQAQAIPDKQGWLLSGSKNFVGLGRDAKIITVFAHQLDADLSSQGVSAFIVERKKLKGSVTDISTLGMKRLRQVHFNFQQTPIADNQLLGESGKGMDIAHSTLHYNRLGVAAMSVGGMQTCLNNMRTYAGQRQITTGLLIDNPVTQERLKDVKQAIYSVEHLVTSLALCLDQGRKAPPELFIAAKTLGANYLWQAADNYVQLLGWRGYDDSHAASQLLKDARAFRIIEGPSETLDHYLGSRLMYSSPELSEFFKDSGSECDELSKLREFASSLNIRPEILMHHIGHIANYAIALMVLRESISLINDEKHQAACHWLQDKIQSHMQRLDKRQLNKPSSAYITPHISIVKLGNEANISIDAEKISETAGNKSSADILQAVQNWISKTSRSRFKPQDIDPEKALYDYGLDSIMVMELSFQLEKFLGRKISADMIWDYPSIGELTSALAEGVSEQAPVHNQLDETPEPALEEPATSGVKSANFSLFYFSSNPAAYDTDKYQLLIEGSKFADQNGFKAVWLPERHFHDFGGIYPSPSILASALAMVTKDIRIRSGSVVLPLHDPIRVAEEWSVTDNLSNGRIDMGFAAGWNVNDFVLSPGNYENRVQIMYDGINTIRQLWRGEEVTAVNGKQESTTIRLFPLPLQKDLPIWITCSGGIERFKEAGAGGHNVITALLFQSDEELQQKIAAYRKARAEHGHEPNEGVVTLMLHTYVGTDIDTVRTVVYEPFIGYLTSSVDLWRQESIKLDELSREEKARVLDYAFERYFNRAALFGTADSLLPRVNRLAGYGVNEFACLIDFGVPRKQVLEGLSRLKALMLSHKPNTLDNKSALSADKPVKQEIPFNKDLQALSDNQKALWFLYKLAPNSHAYDVIVAYHLRSPHVASLQAALNQLLERHRVLSAGILLVEDEVYLQSGRFSTVALMISDNSDESWQKLSEGLRPESYPVFDLEADQLFQGYLYQCTDDQSVFVLRAHHIVSDFWSSGVISRELQMLYQAAHSEKKISLPAAHSYSDYVNQQAHLLNSSRIDALWSYWLDRLKTATTYLQLPHDKPSQLQPGFSGDSIHLTLKADIADDLRKLANRANTTLFTVLLSVYGVFLHRYTNQNDILIGTPSLGRNDARYFSSVGYFANTLVIRADLTNKPDVYQLLARLDVEVKAASAHQDMPFSRLVEQLQPEQSRGRSPLIQVLFDMLTPERFEQMIARAIPDVDGIDGSEMSLQALPIVQQQGQFELALEVIEQGKELTFVLKYNNELFHTKTAQRMADNLQNLVVSFVADAHTPVSQLKLISEQEQALIKSTFWRQKQKIKLIPLTTRFQNQADKTPENIALIDGQQKLTYRQLDQRAHGVAQVLLAAGVEAGEVVAVQLERSAENIIAIIGILKAGCAYLPIDACLPRERTTGILKDAKVTTVLTRKNLCDYTPSLECKRIYIDELTAQEFDGSIELPTIRIEDTAYVIYTSGSTGKPKGVPISHANVSHLLQHMFTTFEFGSADVWSVFHSSSFDFSVWEIWGALTSGGSLLLVPLDVAKDPQSFYTMVREHKVTILNQTPSAFQQFSQVDARVHLRDRVSLRMVFFSGERLNVDMLRPWFDRHPTEKTPIYNMYGITETTVFSTLRRITPDDLNSSTSPIGLPFDDSSIYLLDIEQQPVPIGVTGEIYIDGMGVASHYLGRDELTRERMLENRLQPGNGKLYKTGDLARININAELEYLGRNDRQVKIRGFRIELAEIESVLLQHVGVAKAVVTLHDNGQSKQLLAYVVSDNQRINLDKSELMTSLRSELPEYMLPSHILFVDSIPMNANGKTDVTQLPLPSMNVSRQENTSLNNDDSRIATIWSDVLGIPVGQVNSNFFDSGGDSLALLRLALEIEKQTGQQISVAELLQHSSLSDQAELIAEKGRVISKPKKHPKRSRKLLMALLTPVLTGLLWLLYRLIMTTVKIEEIDKPTELESGTTKRRSLLIAHWHGDGLLLLNSWLHRDIVLMASKSQDGRLMAKILSRQGFRIVFGSQGSGASTGIQELIHEVQNGALVALAVDGSRGPIHAVKRGIIELSQQTQVPIKCIAGACTNSWIFHKSWDKAALPKPFSRVIIKYGETIAPPAKDANEHSDEYRNTMRAVQNALSLTKRTAERISQATVKE